MDGGVGGRIRTGPALVTVRPGSGTCFHLPVKGATTWENGFIFSSLKVVNFSPR
jgi:hypothetical protein